MKRWLTLTALATSAALAIACGSLTSDAPARAPKRGRKAAARVPPPPAPEPTPAPRHREAEPLPDKPPLTKAKRVTIRVLPDGSFEPRAVTVRAGTEVTWELSDPYRQSLAPLASAKGDPCTHVAPYRGGANDLTGPMPRNPSGVFILNQDGPGLVEVNGTFEPRGPLGAINDLSWESDRNVGGYLRLRWNWIQPDGEGQYDWTILDREVEKAVANGKLYSVAVKAGYHGTPDWIFDAGVDRLVFRDFGSHQGVDECKCGSFMALGSPTQERYQELYFDMLEAVADHLKENAAWYRHLAYIKPSGANLYSAENRLPKRCTCEKVCSGPDKVCKVPIPWKDAPGLDGSGRICNTKVWAEAGYTPQGLMAYYARQLDTLATSYPEKDFAYLLIHDGFPRVADRTHYLKCGQGKDAKGVPPPVVQTKEILKRSWQTYGPRFTIQHAGLRADKEVNLLLRTERQPTQFIGLQTTNDVTTASKLKTVLEHGMKTTDAMFYEVYEAGAIDAERRGAPDFNRMLHQLRKREASGDGPRRDPFPETHRHTFRKAGAVPFLNPSTCHTDTPATGVVYVE